MCKLASPRAHALRILSGPFIRLGNVCSTLQCMARGRKLATSAPAQTSVGARPLSCLNPSLAGALSCVTIYTNCNFLTLPSCPTSRMLCRHQQQAVEAKNLSEGGAGACAARPRALHCRRRADIRRGSHARSGSRGVRLSGTGQPRGQPRRGEQSLLYFSVVLRNSVPCRPLRVRYLPLHLQHCCLAGQVSAVVRNVPLPTHMMIICRTLP